MFDLTGYHSRAPTCCLQQFTSVVIIHLFRGEEVFGHKREKVACSVVTFD